jgi:YmgG-like glycine-zipper protein
MRTTQTAVLLFSVTLLAGACSRTAETPAPAPASPASAPAADTPAAPPDSSRQPDAPAAQPSNPPANESAAAKTAAPIAPVAPVAPAPPPPPKYKEVTLAEGTMLALRLDTALASDTSTVEEPIHATLRKSLVSDGLTVVPEGTRVTGVVTDVARSGKVKGLARLSVRFTSLTVDDERYEIRTHTLSREAKSTKKKDATKVGVGTGAGALIGAIAGGGKGAAIGAGVGAAAGTGVVMATRGEEVRLAEGTSLTATLASPLTVRVLLRR